MMYDLQYLFPEKVFKTGQSPEDIHKGAYMCATAPAGEERVWLELLAFDMIG